MTDVIKKDPWTSLDKDDLRAIARDLFKKVDMVRAFEQDYEAAIAILRDVYDRGRSRGAYETQDGARC